MGVDIGWKRLLLADGPRQVINALTLYSFASANNWSTDISTYSKGNLLTAVLLCAITFSVVVFVGV